MSEQFKSSRGRRKFLIFLLVVLIISGSGWIAFNYVENGGSFKKNIGVPIIDDSNSVIIDIPEGASTETISELLKSKNLINYAIIFKFISKYKHYDNQYQFGKHKVASGLTYQQLMDILIQSPAVENDGKLTVPEGYAIKQISQKIGGIKDFNPKTFEENLVIDKFDYRFLNEIPKDSYSKRKYLFEGYLFPDTYELGKDETEETIIKKMLDRFNEVFVDKYYNRAKELNMTVDQVITLASLIEREAKINDERKIISSVINNRLKRNDYLKKLQIDATIQYVLLCETGSVKELLLNSDLQIDDLYNTYKYEKLPPGPICSPGKKSIEAALYPEDTEYYYYVLKGDKSGKHNFAKTHDEFEKYKDEYMKAIIDK